MSPPETTSKPVISAAYAEMNRTLHEDKEDFGLNTNEDTIRGVADLAKLNGYEVILDFGCGKGTFKKTLARMAPRIKVLEYDPGIKGKDVMPKRRPDLVVALDVMEHIEPDYLDNVLTTLRDTGAQAVLMLISTIPAVKTLPDGRNAHLILESKAWWEDRLKQYFRPILCDDWGPHFLYLGGPLLK